MISSVPQGNRGPVNATITRERSYAARTVSLADAKAISKASGTKLNDVVMAICAGALRRYLQEKGQLPDKPLIAGVPISLREPGDTRQNNQVSGMLCSIATYIADPVERLKAILKSSSESKQIAGTFRDAVPQDFAFVGAPILLQLIMLVYGRSGLADKLPMPMNVTISNVPGPPMPLYCAGAKVTALHPVSIPAHGAALNITVQSYMDALNFGLTADRRAYRHFACPVVRAGEQEVRHVDARHEQHQRHRAKQDEQRRPDAAHDTLLQPRRGHDAVLVVGWIRARELCRRVCHRALRLLQRQA